MSPPTSHVELGRFGEECAARHLVSRGYFVLRRNWRSPAGEVDIVAQHRDVTVLCEVKTRRGTDFGHPSEAIDGRRLTRLAGAAECWMSDHPASSVRIDAIAVRVCSSQVEVQHIEGVTW